MILDHGCEWCKITPAILQQVDLGNPYPFSIGPKGRERLAQLISRESYITIFSESSASVINQKLRSEIALRLSAVNREKAEALALWIIREWGGIRRRTQQSVVNWLENLGCFDDHSVRRFIRDQESSAQNGVSSWSKLLAFAAHMNYAIYDSRTATSLNCVLSLNNDPRRFYMPPSRNTAVQSAQAILSRESNLKVRRYNDYLALLNCITNNKKSETLLTAEMMLFSNAPMIAKTFIFAKTERKKI